MQDANQFANSLKNFTNKAIDHNKKEVERVLAIDGAGELEIKKIISNHMKELQKKSSAARLRNDPNTYKKMRAIRTENEKEGDLEIKTE